MLTEYENSIYQQLGRPYIQQKQQQLSLRPKQVGMAYVNPH